MVSQSRERFKTHKRQDTANEQVTPRERRRGGQDTTRPHTQDRRASPHPQNRERGETTEHTAQDAGDEDAASEAELGEETLPVKKKARRGASKKKHMSGDAKAAAARKADN